ncbi:hypothetical protein [Dyella flagellata]|uniref:Uncharacterized protein n=1 Tax=Dyella flagellata TaxID=1867833 RepID=A0ABQ5XGK7_9GAMM|nr:hypothetical protein [Dyella flagellata]GLQ90835.1 hypothetical protein GCM10007898_44110 [Dyella flagellata]
MSNYVCRYPDGPAGLALLIVRMSYAVVAFGIVATMPTGHVGGAFPYVASGLVALSLLIGLATRWAALLLGMAAAIDLAAAGPIQQLILTGHIGACALIVLIGPGAFSIDAKRHGRRVIHLNSNTPDRGADN